MGEIEPGAVTEEGGVAMRLRCTSTWVAVMMFLSVVWFLSIATEAQLTDITQTPNAENAGVQKSLGEQIGTDQVM